MFRLGDLIIYAFILSLIIVLSINIVNFKETSGSKAEIYIKNSLYRVEDLKNNKDFFVPTELGGIKVQILNNKIRVISSNSPKKIIVKQGFISKVGETLIGVPDKVLIKIAGESDLDYIIK